MPSFRLRVPATVAASLLLVAATGCVDDAPAADCDPSDTPIESDLTLVVEGDPWSGYAPFRSADLLDDTGYRLLYIEQLCQDIRADDLSQGDADFILTTLDQYLLNEPDGTVVGVIDQSQGADALVLNTKQHSYLTGIDNLAQLVDEYEQNDTKPVIAYTGSSPSEMLLNELANTTEELRLGDFELVEVGQSADAVEMLDSYEAQVAVLWEPDVSYARSRGYSVTLSSEDAPDAIVDVLVAADELIERDPDAVQALVDGYYGAVDGYLADAAGRADLEALIADDGGLDTDQAKSVIAGMKLYSAQEADAFMNEDIFPLDQPRIEQSMRSIGALVALLNPGVDLDEAHIDGSYVAQAAR